MDFIIFCLQASGIKQVGIENINQLLENFMGINDSELGMFIYSHVILKYIFTYL